MNDNNTTLHLNPSEYRKKMFLTVDDLIQLTESSSSLIYSWINSKEIPFRVEKIGPKKWIIFSNSFFNWYDGNVA
ncbi:MAG TPA: hypothetical protein VJZ04_02760 [Lachnospiraceae bacterium]|nr:hypothetical protein [Lachnospiraceae bacterium]